ncbi:hypothetical protein [Streptomyces boluensis]|uniref:hypothetical protein n=1 Tax=Streptomyces boluensis TaxID=1775135 RepID=UPI0028AA7E6F|nr:hypothetical protein [Streptomyces boluensis]
MRAANAERRSSAPVFGSSPDWLLEDGRPLASATVLSHPEQLARLVDRERLAGLDAIPPLEGRRQALIAADCVVGDHSSVT